MSLFSYLQIQKLFNANEWKALSTLFKTPEEFESFNKKIEILQKVKDQSDKNSNNQIKLLQKDNSNKNEEIQYLTEKLKEYERKMNVLVNSLNQEKNAKMK